MVKLLAFKLIVLSILLICFSPGCNKPEHSESIQIQYASKRPNILWISAEDLSPRLGCYGDSLAQTPILDRLAEEGMRFTNVFTSAPVSLHLCIRRPSDHTICAQLN